MKVIYSMRLATVERVVAKTSIDNAENIELVTVLGWQCVTKKGEFQIGDMGVYIPIDTTVDTNMECFAFLQDNKKPNARARIRTARIRGVFSQGLFLPLQKVGLHDVEEGLDVTDMLGVLKYEKEAEPEFRGRNDTIGEFPKHLIAITDEYNLQTKHLCLREFEGLETYITLKMDGSSMTIIKEGDGITVCSRRFIINDSTVMSQYVKSREIHTRMMAYGKNLAIQGEFCGPKVNGNRMRLKEYRFFVFTVKDLDNHRLLGLNETQVVCKDLGLEMVPVLETFHYSDAWSLDKFREYANNVYYDVPGVKVHAEGIVIRPVVPVYSPYLGKSLSFKVINQFYRD